MFVYLQYELYILGRCILHLCITHFSVKQFCYRVKNPFSLRNLLPSLRIYNLSIQIWKCCGLLIVCLAAGKLLTQVPE
jgi:hypothetical protein